MPPIVGLIPVSVPATPPASPIAVSLADMDVFVASDAAAMSAAFTKIADQQIILTETGALLA